MSATERIGARVISETSEGSPPDDVSLVRRAQVLLNRIAGSGRLDEDGALDGDTAEAVARFQETADLPSTGALDAATFAAYRAVTADDVSLALGEEAAGWLGGMAGWAAGSYVGALACAEAAPVCVGAVALGGAIAGDVGSRVLFESAIEAVVVEEPVVP